jgi:hypothetical protein
MIGERLRFWGPLQFESDQHFQGVKTGACLITGTLPPFIRLLKNKGFKEDAGRTNRVVRHGFIHDPGIQQEPRCVRGDNYSPLMHGHT